MKVELTQRDKKLLTFLGVFVIIVCIGYWGIIPQIKAANDYDDEIAEEEVLTDYYQQKINQLAVVQKNNNDLENLISGAKDNYYPVMDSDAIDNLITNKVIDDYKLMAYDLYIGDRMAAGLNPYVYSKKNITGQSDAKQRALAAAAPVVSEDGMLLFGEVVGADTATTGIYVVPVQLRLGGDKKDIVRLLDDLAYSPKKLRLVSYSVGTEETRIPHDDGTEEVFYKEILDLAVELYMCAD